MAIYHCAVKTISRRRGQSAVAAEAYRSGTRLRDERRGVVHDYRNRSGVLHREIVLPPIDDVVWAYDREILWNLAEHAERRRDAKVAREYQVALPRELASSVRIGLAVRFARHIVDRFGVAASVAVHVPSASGDARNFHVHILTTTRCITGTGFGAKTRSLDVRSSSGQLIRQLRQQWSDLVNDALARADADVRVDHRSHQARGLETHATRHEGPKVTWLRRERGILTDRACENDALRAANRDIQTAAAARARARLQPFFAPELRDPGSFVARVGAQHLADAMHAVAGLESMPARPPRDSSPRSMRIR